MKTQTKCMLFMTVAFLLFFNVIALAGNLEPSAPPSDSSSAMYTLEDIFNYLDTGIAGAKRSGEFTEPSSSPGTTSHTLDEIHEKITEKCITCSGTLSPGGRWCNRGDGTVMDMATGLIWLRDVSWGGTYQLWEDTLTGYDAYDRVTACYASIVSSLSDGSVKGDWRLPTSGELNSIIQGVEPITYATPQFFQNIASGYYWSCTQSNYSDAAITLGLFTDETGLANAQKNSDYIHVWPVRMQK